MPESLLLGIVFVIAVIAVGMVFWYASAGKSKATHTNAYLEALEKMVDGDQAGAIQRFKDAIREDSDNIAAYIRLGDLLREGGLAANAVRVHRDLTLRHNLSDETLLKIRKSLLLDYEATGEYSRGITSAFEILEQERHPDPAVVRKIVMMLEKQEQWKEAEAVINKHSDLFKEDKAGRLAMYRVYQALKMAEGDHYKEAQATLKDAIRKDPNCAAAYFYLGKLYHEDNRLDDAIKEWKKICSDMPEKSHFVFPELEKAWFEAGRFNDAERLYQDLLTSRNNAVNTGAGLALAEIYQKKGDYESAINVLKQLEEGPESYESVARKKIALLFNRGEFKQAAAEALGFLQEKNGKPTPTNGCIACNEFVATPEWICSECNHHSS